MLKVWVEGVRGGVNLSLSDLPDLPDFLPELPSWFVCLVWFLICVVCLMAIGYKRMFFMPLRLSEVLSISLRTKQPEVDVLWQVCAALLQVKEAIHGYIPINSNTYIRSSIYAVCVSSANSVPYCLVVPTAKLGYGFIKMEIAASEAGFWCRGREKTQQHNVFYTM